MSANCVAGGGCRERGSKYRRCIAAKLNGGRLQKSSENRQLQNSVDDHGNIIAINLDAKVGARVQRPPVVKKLGEAFVVASERASRIVAETLAHRLYRTVEPNCHTVILNQLPIARLGERAASQRDNARMTCFNPLHTTAN